MKLKLLFAFAWLGLFCSSRAQKVTVHIVNKNPDHYLHTYTKNEDWNGFFSDKNHPRGTLLHDGSGGFYFSVDIDSLGLGSGERADVVSDTYVFRGTADSIISLSDYGASMGNLMVNNIRGPELAGSIRVYFQFPNSKQVKVGVPFTRSETRETDDYNPGLFYGVNSWRGGSFDYANLFTGDSLSLPRLSPLLGKLRWTQKDTVVITQKRWMKGRLIVDGWFSERLNSALANPYKGSSYEKTWYMEGKFENLVWR